MRNQEWDAALAQLHPLDLAELVLSLLASDAVDSETALGVVDEAEVLAGLLDGDDIHVASRVGGVGADLAIDLDEALHDNGLHLATVEGVLQTARKLTLARVPSRFRLLSRSLWFFCAYRLRMKTMSGMQSRSLCGPGEALGA
jgi:hypothetical protein